MDIGTEETVKSELQGATDPGVFSEPVTTTTENAKEGLVRERSRFS
jgi:hypothetical protein